MKKTKYVLSVLITFSLLNVSGQDCFIGENLNNPFSQDPYSVNQYNGRIYEGGWFHLRRLENGTWSNFGGGIGGGQVKVNALMHYQGKLIIGGEFVTAGSLTVNSICSWNDTSYAAIGSGFDGLVNTITEWDGKLVAGGNFVSDISGSKTFNLIAIWDGNSWEPLGGGFTGVTPGFIPEVMEVGVYNGDLIAVGRFKFADENTAVNSIARWDGTSWQPFGAGLYSSSITDGLGIGHSLITYDSKLVVSGWFNQVAGNNISWIAAWDGNEWSNFGSEPDRHCLDLEIYDGNLYGAGPLSFEIGGEDYTMAYWDGISWTGAVQVNTNWVYDMSVSENDSILYFCGPFNTANGVTTTNVAQWICEGAVDISENESAVSKDFELNAPYPNPFNSNLNIPFVLNKTGNVELSVYNLQGSKIVTILSEYTVAGKYSATWDGRDGSGNTPGQGSYLVKLDVNGISITRSIILLKY